MTSERRDAAAHEMTEFRAVLRRPLSGRQEQVARLVATGMSYKKIGASLGISKRTVERHVHIIADRLPADDCTPYRRVQVWAMRVFYSAA